MPLDTSIYNSVRPFSMGDPLESAGKALALRDAQRKFTLEDDLAAAGAASDGDPEKMAQELMARGHYAPAIQLRSQAATLDKEKRLAANADLDRKLKLYEAAGSDAMALDGVYRQALQQAGGDRNRAVEAVTPVYQQARQKWAGLGVQLPEVFDPDANFAHIGQAKEALQYLKTLAPDIKMTDAGGQIVPTNVNPNAGPIGPISGATPIPKTAPPSAPTELARYQAERAEIAKTNPNDPRLAQYDRVIANFKAGRGTDVTIQQPGPMTPGKTAGNKVDEDLLGVTRNLMQLDNIAAQFKPEFQRFQDKAGFAALKVKDSTVGLTNKEKRDLSEYSSYRRNAFNTLNDYIKSVTGAAMSEAEANRIRKSMPDPGDGIFGGDSPTEFKAKLDDTLRQTKMAVARLSYIKRNGMSLEDGNGNPVVPLERMPALINQRGQEIEKELRATQPKADAKAIQKAVRRQLSVEFGLSSD